MLDFEQSFGWLCLPSDADRLSLIRHFETFDGGGDAMDDEAGGLFKNLRIGIS